MSLTLALMNEEDAHVILTWSYEGRYAAYNTSDPGGMAVAEMLDLRSPHYVVRDEQGELIGSFSFGTSTLVWESDESGIYVDDRTIPIGLGMRPDLTGKGLGQAFVEAGLAFARQAFAPKHFLLFVYAWNERAIRVYESVGFQRVRVFTQKNIHGENEFVEMRKDYR